ncbi:MULTISPECIES: hypothetical protein [Ehrlichia]|uniref:Uncharacterized protein n=1 Tax=Ehrlichia cf. muris str. EmCRT TaxID=1359167 RepID=A0A0F3NBY7_9RICK|nr:MULTISPECIES: hypothetical protein [Ehrlichia]KJV65578.1 hypothetical protein EMUCRT_0523 [Ehrlichia cf. muris str. EmCRT]OUC04456.1 hypothetical protein DB91_02685 [Ehrlichia sp. Wisconsin_h]
MLTGKFKQGAFINHLESHLASFLRDVGFSNADILAFACIVKSFHQNVASYIPYYALDNCVVHSNSHVEFGICAHDHRNYLSYHKILQQLDSEGELNLASTGSLWFTQMYALLRVCACATQYILSGKCCTDEEIAKKLQDDIEHMCACIMNRGTVDQDNVDRDALLKYFQQFSCIVLGENHITLPDALANLVRYIRTQYSLAVQDLKETCSKDVLLRLITLIIYKAAMNRFSAINCNALSSTFQYHIFPMLAQFVCNGIDTLPPSCRSRLGINEKSVLLGFYRDLFFVFRDNDISAYYQSEDDLAAAVVGDVCLSIERSLTVVTDASMGYNPFGICRTDFVVYDTMLAVNEVLKDKNLEAALVFEHTMLLYKTLLTEELGVVHNLFITGLSDFIFKYVDEGKSKVGAELVLELLFTCYHAAFMQEQRIDTVKQFYDKCYGKLCALANSVSMSPACSNEKVLSYKLYKRQLETVYGYKQIGCLDIKYDRNLLCILIQHLLLGKINGERVTTSQLTYSVFLECKPVNEVKAQQAAMMLCQAFKKSDGAIDSCSVKGVTGLLMVLLFGNFLQRNIVLRLLNVCHIAYRKSKECGAKESVLSSTAITYFYVILNLLKHLNDRLPFSCSMKDVENLDSDSAAVYSQVMNMINSYAHELGLSLSDLECTRDTKYDADFSEILSSMPTSSEEQSNPDMQINPCSSFDRAQCLLSIQLMSSYVCLYDSDRAASDLFSGNLCCSSFLLGSILTCPSLLGNFVGLCREYTLMKAYPVEKKFSEILKLLCSEEELSQPSGDVKVIGEIVAKGNHVLTKDIMQKLIQEDGSSNVSETILKDACLSIMKLRGLIHNSVVQDLKSAYRLFPDQYIIEPALVAKVLSLEDTFVANLMDNVDGEHHLIPMQTGLYVKHDDNNNDCESGSKECDFKTKKVLPDGNVDIREGSLIVNDKTVVDQKPEDIVAQGATLQPSINEIKEPERHGRPDSRVCDRTQLDKKSEALQKRIHCLIVTAGTMISTFVILMYIAFTCQMSRQLFVGYIVGAITCLTLLIMSCLATCVSIHALAMNHDENDVEPQSTLEDGEIAAQEPELHDRFQ